MWYRKGHKIAVYLACIMQLAQFVPGYSEESIFSLFNCTRWQDLLIKVASIVFIYCKTHKWLKLNSIVKTMVKAFTNTAITAKALKSTTSAVNWSVHWAYWLREQQLISFHAEPVSLWGVYGCSKRVNGPFVSSCVPALPCLISAASEIRCVQSEDTFGGKKIKLLFFTQKFPAGFSRTEGQEWEYCLWRMWGIRQTVLGATGTEQGSPSVLSFDIDSRSHSGNHILQLRDHRMAAGSLLRHGMLIIYEQSWQGFMHRQIIFCLPLFLMTALHLLGVCGGMVLHHKMLSSGIPGTSRGAPCSRGEWGTWQVLPW